MYRRRNYSSSGLTLKHFILLALFLLGVAAIVLMIVNHQESFDGRISRNFAERTIWIDVFASNRLEGWDETVPKEAYNRDTSRRQRSTRSVRDGEDCRNVFQSDGTTKRKCTTKYRSEPVYDTWVQYNLNSWTPSYLFKWYDQTEVENGIVVPEWPATEYKGRGTCAAVERNQRINADTATDSWLGCERIGQKIAEYKVRIDFYRGNDLIRGVCGFEQENWESMLVGDALTGSFWTAYNMIDCSTVKEVKQ